MDIGNISVFLRDVSQLLDEPALDPVFGRPRYDINIESNKTLILDVPGCDKTDIKLTLAKGILRVYVKDTLKHTIRVHPDITSEAITSRVEKGQLKINVNPPRASPEEETLKIS